jgi:Fuc2NAc and GlcNAc transferase
MQNFLYVGIGASLGWTGAWFIQEYGHILGIVDVPNERSSHTNVIPKGGGIGILLAFAVCSILLGIPASFWASAFILAVVSFIGDRLDIKPKVRLVIQFFCGLVFFSGVIVSGNGQAAVYLLIPFFLVYMVGTANFYNFMDGINGIAGITGLVGFLLLASYGNSAGCDPRFISIAIVMASACAGFLPVNFPRAKVFMGDVGSVLLGFVFSGLVIIISNSLLDFIVLTSFLLPFYADELTTMAVRIHEGDRLTEAHRKHVYQLLANECGIPHWKVTLGYGLAQLTIGGATMSLEKFGYLPVVSTLGIALIWFCILSVNIRYRLKEKRI